MLLQEISETKGKKLTAKIPYDSLTSLCMNIIGNDNKGKYSSLMYSKVS